MGAADVCCARNSGNAELRLRRSVYCGLALGEEPVGEANVEGE